MPAVLHLIKGAEVGQVLATIGAQLVAGDRVSVALLHGAPVPKVPVEVTLHRVPEDLSYERLLELIFAADQVLSW
jgi:hypothetical protein